MILVDTNIFLELFLDQEKAEDVKQFLDKVSRGDIEAIVTDFTVHACEVLLNNPNLILLFLRNIEGSLGITIYNTSIGDGIASSMLMDKIGLDFDDSLQYYVAKKVGVEAIISFDKHFDKVDIVRREPSYYI